MVNPSAVNTHIKTSRPAAYPLCIYVSVSRQKRNSVPGDYRDSCCLLVTWPIARPPDTDLDLGRARQLFKSDGGRHIPRRKLREAWNLLRIPCTWLSRHTHTHADKELTINNKCICRLSDLQHMRWDSNMKPWDGQESMRSKVKLFFVVRFMQRWHRNVLLSSLIHRQGNGWLPGDTVATGVF